MMKTARLGASPVMIALMRNRTAAIFMVNSRPKRSANFPAVRAPRAAPSRAEATAKPSGPGATLNSSATAATAPLMTALS
jgi:hypothetical protein